MGSSNLDGVVILDASVAANRSQRHRGSQDRTTDTETGGSSYHTKTSSSDEDGSAHSESAQGSTSKTCQVLGSAVPGGSDHNGPGAKSPFGSLLERDLTRMLHDYPDGKIITFVSNFYVSMRHTLICIDTNQDIEGLALSSTDEGTISAASESSMNESPTRKRHAKRASQASNALTAMLPGARSVAFVPFWDFERSRWFAGCICWSNSTHRMLSTSLDLAYFKVFSHSIMRELSRLDAIVSNQAKTTFVSSISHELRSPLHGILGTLEFIKDTPLDSFQTSMLNSLNACGQTLLDTINHVMDYAKISEGKKNVSSKSVKSSHTVRLSSKPLKTRRSKAGAFDLGIATEEVIEAVFSG
jgi:hypothetical protein